MSEILLQAIVEKLETLEIILLKHGNVSKDEELSTAIKLLQSEFIKFSSDFKTNNEKIKTLSEEINALRLRSDNSMRKEIKHTHHFHKRVWITVSLFIISLLLAYGWINCSNEKKSFEANDMKYRYWKADGNASLLRLTYYTDSLYDMDKESFKKQVISAEQQIADQVKQFRLAGEKEKK